MALNIKEKRAVVYEVTEVVKYAFSAVAAEYHGLNVSDMTMLRVLARKDNVYLRVVRNTLAKLAVEATNFACMQEGMTGPLIFGFSTRDPGAVARVMSSFAKNNDKFKIRMVSLGCKLLPVIDIEKLAKLPTKNEAIVILINTMKTPIEKFVRTLAVPISKVIYTLAAVNDVKEEA